MATYQITADDDLSLSSAFAFIYGVTEDETIRLRETTLSFAYFAGAIVSDTIRISRAIGVSAIFSPTIEELVSFFSSFIHSFQETISDHVVLSDARHIAWAMTILQGLKVGSNFAGSSAKYGIALLETIMLNDSILSFFGMTLSDTFSIHPSYAPSWAFARTISAGFNMSSSLLASTLFFRVIADDLNLEDEELVQAILLGTLSENVEIMAGWIDPGTGEFTTWAVNTRTSAVTEYQNYVFNSFAKIGNSYYGAASDGLYLLEGPDDNGANIVADLKSGFIQLGGSRFAQLDGVYLGMRTDDNARDFILKICTPGTPAVSTGTTYIYQFNPKNMQTTRVNIGKGLRTRYFSWELLTPGPEFDLDSLEFVPIISKRRI